MPKKINYKDERGNKLQSTHIDEEKIEFDMMNIAKAISILNFILKCRKEKSIPYFTFHENGDIIYQKMKSEE
jgi:hypothetical protein